MTVALSVVAQLCILGCLLILTPGPGTARIAYLGLLIAACVLTIGPLIF